MARRTSSGGGCGAVVVGLIVLGAVLYAVSGLGHLLSLTPTADELGSDAEKRYENVGLGYVLTALVIVAPVALYLVGRWWKRTHPEDQNGLIAITAGPAVALLLAVVLLPAGPRSAPTTPSARGIDFGGVPSPSQGHHSHHRHHHAKPTPARHHKPKPKPAPSEPPGCPPSSKALAGVYHPDRLAVRDSCRHITGTVILVRPTEEDGDLHFDVRLDPAYKGMLMANNYSEQSGRLVVEFMPRDYGHLPAPSAGDDVSLTGAYVDDTYHSWAELHPVWSVSINGGQTHVSGPQFGGSPASALSTNALASCQTNTGAQCTGYGGATASPPPSSGGGSDEGGSGGASGGGCTPGYSPCIAPGSDVDCEGGGGDGPRYVGGPVQVSGSDPYALDSNHDGVGCEP